MRRIDFRIHEKSKFRHGQARAIYIKGKVTYPISRSLGFNTSKCVYQSQKMSETLKSEERIVKRRSEG